MNQNDSNSKNNDSNNEIQSFIYQQIAEFEPFVTPETLVMVVARDPNDDDSKSDVIDRNYVTDVQKNIHRIAIVLKENEASIEAEAQHEDIFQAIRLAKEALLEHLIQISDEVNDPKERLQFIEQINANEQIH
jgi:ribosome-associated translation inhibitor RaiA